MCTADDALIGRGDIEIVAASTGGPAAGMRRIALTVLALGGAVLLLARRATRRRVD